MPPGCGANPCGMLAIISCVDYPRAVDIESRLNTFRIACASSSGGRVCGLERWGDREGLWNRPMHSTRPTPMAMGRSSHRYCVDARRRHRFGRKGSSAQSRSSRRVVVCRKERIHERDGNIEARTREDKGGPDQTSTDRQGAFRWQSAR